MRKLTASALHALPSLLHALLLALSFLPVVAVCLYVAWKEEGEEDSCP